MLLRLLFTTLALASTALAADFATAKRLFDEHRYPEARALFEELVAAEPRNAAAWHYLGRCWEARGDTPAFEQAVKALAKAAELEPNNAAYLGIYGGTALQLAGRTTSFTAATHGRDAMERALALDPDYLDAREGLFQFYERAPWPIGSSAKAAAQLEEIRRRDPDRATVLEVMTKANAKDYATAFRLCDQVLAKEPDNYTALYQYGRTASVSGQNLERGLASLKKCLALTPPSPASPTHSHVWHRIGRIEEQRQHPAEARAAYESALQIDASNKQAADALAKLH